MFDHVFVIQTSNYRWVLGHWVRELRKRIPGHNLIWWVPVSFSRSNYFNEFVKIVPLPPAKNYYFPFPSIFKHYYSQFPNTLKDRSIVLYTHEITQLGSPEDQAKCLNMAKRVHFMCSADRNRLVSAGLDIDKTRVILGAVDVDCIQNKSFPKKNNSILLSSRFGPRKGFELLPNIIDSLPNWTFTVLGPGWNEHLTSTGLITRKNVIHAKWSRENRNRLMSENQVFLSLSSLEGGPIPLIDAMAFGMYPIATDTGFARDVITQDGVGTLLKMPTSSEEVITAINGARLNPGMSISVVAELTWDNLAKQYILDTH